MHGYQLGADGYYHDNPIFEASALVFSGIVFSLVPPRHLKFGYFIWILVSIVLLLCNRWETDYEIRTHPDDPNLNMIGVGAGFLWLASVLAVNPICYFLGKYVWKRVANLRGGEMDGRVKPGHDMRAS